MSDAHTTFFVTGELRCETAVRAFAVARGSQQVLSS